MQVQHLGLVLGFVLLVCLLVSTSSATTTIAPSQFRIRGVAVHPTIGPLSGGTRVTITSFTLSFWPSFIIRLAGVQVSPIFPINTTTIIFRTPRGSQIDIPLSISIEINNIQWPLSQNFTYRPDPIVTRIEPRESIISGGTIVTVTGVGLDVVGDPFLQVTVLYDGNPVDFLDSICRTVSSTIMHCPVPKFDIFTPDGEIDPAVLSGSSPAASKKRRRSIDSLNRYRRQAAGTVNNDRVQFQVGVLLDAVRMYQTFSNFTVYIDPELYRWDGVMVVTKFGRELEVKGANLLRGLDATDYTMLIGQSECGTLEVYNNLLTCEAPKETPVPHKDNTDTTGILHVRVLFGLNKEGTAGQVRYMTDFFDDPLTRRGIIGGGVALGVIIIIAIIICAVRKYRNRNNV